LKNLTFYNSANNGDIDLKFEPDSYGDMPTCAKCFLRYNGTVQNQCTLAVTLTFDLSWQQKKPLDRFLQKLFSAVLCPIRISCKIFRAIAAVLRTLDRTLTDKQTDRHTLLTRSGLSVERGAHLVQGAAPRFGCAAPHSGCALKIGTSVSF
jgi:hypothetical protein